MSILRKPLIAVTLADLDDLIKAGARETGELEFKGALPVASIRGQTVTADRWIEKGDRIGDYARDQILAEIVAFANADGGTLVLGLHETKDVPRRADRLEPLPDCEGLAKRLLDATEDVIEPRLPAVEIRALQAVVDGSGYVLLRVGKSLTGPHRLTTTREFYVRRGERAARMTVREVKDRTLDLARAGDRIESIFIERSAFAAKQYATLIRDAAAKVGDAIMPLIIRVTAVPTSPQNIPSLTQRRDLWWRGKRFTMKLDNEDYACDCPARNWNEEPTIRLRSLVSEADLTTDSTPRFIRSDGLVEFSLIRPKRTPISSSESRIYFSWLICLVAGVIAQTTHLRNLLAWDAVEFGLEIQIWSTAPLGVFWNDRSYNNYLLRAELPLTLPRYSLASGEDYDDLISTVVRDILNACGANSPIVCQLPWSELRN